MYDTPENMVRDLLWHELKNWDNLRAAYVNNPEYRRDITLTVQVLTEVVEATQREGLALDASARIIRDTWAGVCQDIQHSFDRAVAARVHTMAGEPLPQLPQHPLI